MTTLDPAPGIDSEFQLGGQLYKNVFAMEHSQTLERIDTTGLGQTFEKWVKGRISFLEITLRFYGTQTQTGSAASGTEFELNLTVGEELPAGYVKWASGLKIAWDAEFATVTSHSSSAGVEGAVEHEVSIGLHNYTRTFE